MPSSAAGFRRRRKKGSETPKGGRLLESRLCLVPILVLVLGPVLGPDRGLAAEFARPGPAPVVRVVNDGQLILEDVPDIPAELAERVQRYQNVRAARFADWAEEGLYILTRFGATDQLHRVLRPGGAREQLTWYHEPIGEVRRQRQGSLLALTMDRGGSEFSQILLFDPGRATTRLISDGQSRNARLVWDRPGRQLAFQSTRRDGRSNDVWLQPVDDPAAARLVLEAEPGGWWSPVDFSRDGRWLLVQQLRSATDSSVHLLDLASGELGLLAGDPHYPSANRAAVFDAADSGIYLVTNSRGLAAELAWQPLQEGEETRFISSAIPWDVIEFALSPDGRRGAFTTNEAGISRLYLLDPRTRRFAPVQGLPLGLIHGLSFHATDRHLAFTLNTAQTPNDVFVLHLGRRPTEAIRLVRWTRSEVGGMDTADFIEPLHFSFPTFDRVNEEPRQIPAFLYRPRGEGPFPVIVYIHGGPESQYRPAFSSQIQMWARELGAAVIAPNVRGSFGYGNQFMSLDDGLLREDAVKDIGALLDWIGQQDFLDARRVAVYGSSYGGYMVLAAAVHFGDRLRAAVDIVGISNFVTFLENTQGYRQELRRREYGDERDPAMRAFLESISPLNHAARIDVPLLVVQGENDPRVPASESEQIVAALRQRGRPVWYLKALNEGHGYARKENRDVAEQAVMRFLEEYLLH